MTGENGIPETPDWTPTPRPSPLDVAGMSRDDEVNDPENIVRGVN